jgi:adenylate cyclase
LARRDEQTLPHRGTGSPAGGGESILIVDDYEPNREILARCLALHGYDVGMAANGSEALAKAATGGYDAVLLDLRMPDMSGLEVLAALREKRAAADLPVIVVTASDGRDEIVEVLGKGANDFVSKPFDFDVLLARLATHLSLKASKERVERLARDLAIRNRFIRGTFGRYLSDDVVEALLETPAGLRLGGERRRVTILMSDLRGFTSLTERMPPERVMQLLNGYLGAMTRIITRYCGTIDEFIGDAILALFGAPFQADDDAERAAACALEMQLAMDAVNAEGAKEGLPPLEMGIALNTGVVVAGNIGSEARAKYGIVGAHVNLTSRIESFTRGGQILVSEHTRRALDPLCAIGRTMEIDAKGFQDRVTVHELLGLLPPYALSLPEPQSMAGGAGAAPMTARTS